MSDEASTRVSRLGLRTTLALGGAMIGALSVPVTALSTGAGTVASAQVVRHITPNGTATLAGTGWSLPTLPPGGGSGKGLPKPDGTGWS